MIIRVFRTKVRPGTHRQYEALIRQQVVPLMLEAPGLVTLHVGLPLDDPPDEFLLMSVWQDLAAMRAFIGSRWREPLVVPGEEHLVLHSIVDHYEGEELTGPASRNGDAVAVGADLVATLPGGAD